MRVAFVGLGHMGLPMAERVATGAGLQVVGFDLSPRARELAGSFAGVAASLEDAVRDADVVCTMLPADAHVVAVADGIAASAAEGALKGRVLVEFSTVSPSAVQTLARRLEPSGMRVVSASCMKSVAAARTGELSLFVGGTAADLERVRPVLDRVATQWQDVGSPTTAKTMKLVNNLLTATTCTTLLDGLVLAHALGCPPAAAVEGLVGVGADSWTLQQQVVRHALADDLGEGIFSVDYMAKDVALAVGLAREVGRPSFFGAFALAAYRGARGLGLQQQYHPVVVRWLERESGVGPITGPAPTSDPHPELSHLWSGLLRVQELLVAEALDIVEATGVPRRRAAELLQSGSARSDVLQGLLDGREVPGRQQVAAELAASLDLAAAVDVPALSVALAGQLVGQGS